MGIKSEAGRKRATTVAALMPPQAVTHQGGAAATAGRCVALHGLGQTALGDVQAQAGQQGWPTLRRERAGNQCCSTSGKKTSHNLEKGQRLLHACHGEPEHDKLQDCPERAHHLNHNDRNVLSPGMEPQKAALLLHDICRLQQAGSGR